MIIFEKIRFQNFLSSGNIFTEIELNKNKLTLIVGKNGSGKTTCIEAIYFALYGKPYRNINKGQLVNTITNKNTLVELEFKIGINKYLIRRGLKPNIFEIFENNNLMNKNSDVKDYQSYLEKKIIKMNGKTFKQVVLLGTTNFVPFMRLDAADRRSMIENLTNIQIFSVMNVLLKSKQSKNKEDLAESSKNIEICENKIKIYEKHQKELNDNNNELIENKKKELKNNQKLLIVMNDYVEKIKNEIEELNKSKTTSKENLEEKINSLSKYEYQFNDKINSSKKEIKFFENNLNCPTCTQPIEESFRFKKIEDNKKIFEKNTNNLDLLKDQLKKINETLKKVKEIDDIISQKNIDIIKTNQKISFINDSNEKINLEISKLMNRQVEQINIDFEDQKKNQVVLLKEREKLLNYKSVLDVSTVLLKDTGIKAKILKKYIPLINNLLSKYLKCFDFMVQFELDEEFKETIKSRYRDTFSYESFSEGEKARIDLALLFTWRELSSIINNASTNLLFLDETFDGSADNEAANDLWKILDNLPNNTNTFVISHKGDTLYDYFSNVIKFEKHKNFSRMLIDEKI